MADTIPPPPGYVIQGATPSLPPPPPGYVVQATTPAFGAADVPLADDYLHPEAMAPERVRTLGDAITGVTGTPEEWERTAALAGRSLVKGVASVPDLVLAPAAGLVNAGLDKLGVDPKYHQATLNDVIDAGWNEAGLPTPANAQERFVDRVEQGLGGVAGGAGIIGQGLSATGSPIAREVGKAFTGNMGAQAAAAVAGSAASSGLHEGGASPAWELAGAVAGGLTPAAVGGVVQGSRAATSALLGQADTQTTALAERARELGIPLKVSQVADSRFGKTLDSVAKGVPFSGAGKFSEAQQAAFNRAVSRTIGEDVDKITPEVFDRALTRVGGEYDRLAEATKVPLGPDLGRTITDIANEAKDFLGPQAQNLVLNLKQRLVDQSVNGVLPGQAFQSIDSALGKIAAAGGENSYIMGKLQEALRDAAEASLAPADAQALAAARQQYRDLKTIEPLVASTGASAGNINPAALQGRVTATKAGKASMARGNRGDLGDLASVGQRFIKEPPNSFTADRQQAMSALKTFGGAVLGGGAGSALGPYGAMAGALLTGGSAVGAARLSQRINQSQTLLDAMLGRGVAIDPLRRGIASSANPSLVELMQGSGN
ncbi:hypothetical protein ACQKIE_00205 [Luteibacter sp. NPDC031894]|uniref:hypothetical protein n=1 Tax=Luteibacter sp. NPDC031894 TaxID=3390572 RepID=UPI003D00F26D